ncbi:VWA domain-containing protein [candidate division KSB1 bacterium]|nr:VWA domain-containing protein [candidate division KSB1 bacterium]
MKTKYSGIFILLFGLLYVSEVYGVGVLFCRRRWSSEEYNKMWIKKVDVDVDIQDQIAVTHVDQIFYNEMTTSVEATYLFPLPENAMITELIYWFNGKRYVAEIKERQEAVKQYNEKVRQWLDPALLEYLGNNLFRLSIVPINPLSEVRTEITYVELPPYDFGRTKYKFLLNALDLSPKALETVTLMVNAKSQSPFKFFDSATHQSSTATQITKISDRYYTLFYGDENYYPSKDFILEFETYRDDVRFDVLTYKPTPEDSFGTDSFYALWITPPDSITKDEIIPKDIVFTADVSGSMDEGNRIGRVKETIYYFLDLLNPQDRFNIITFSTYVDQFQPDLVQASEPYIAEARDYVFQMYAFGMTDINEAVKSSLSLSYRDTSSNNIIFLTDGMPTIGVTLPSVIIDSSKIYNTNDVRLFAFGIGEEVSRSFLTRLAKENNAYATYIMDDDSIAIVVKNHYTRISKPVLTDLEITLEGLLNWDVYPKVLSDLYWGTQLLQFGLYTNSGDFDVTLSGNMRSVPIEYSKIVSFADTLGGHRFVPRLWAKSKIDALFEYMEIYGESEEIKNQIIDLSIRFGVLTKYTAFYADPTLVEKDKYPNLLRDFMLTQNYPNPFNNYTVIQYTLPDSKNTYTVNLTIYDMMGRVVRRLVNQNQEGGSYSVQWDGLDSNGVRVVSGIYIYVLKVEGMTISKKMILLQ